MNVGLPGNLLQVEPTQGMIPVTSDTKEITDQDVENVVKSALTKSMTPDREVITFYSRRIYRRWFPRYS